MKIKTKLYASAFVSIGLLSTLSLLFFIFSFKVNVERKKEILADKFKTGATSVIILAHQYTDFQSTRTVKLLDKRLMMIEEIIKQAEGQLPLKIIRNSFVSLKDSYAHLKAIHKESKELIKTNNNHMGFERTVSLEEAMVTLLLTESHKIMDIASRISDEAQNNMIKLEKKGNLVLIAFSLLLVIVIGISALRIAKGISMPLSFLTKSADTISKGDLDTRVPDLGLDEFGELSRTFDFMRRSRKAAENELKKYQEQLEEMVNERTAQLVIAKDHAESADRLKSAFLASMSHELRTPLNSIIGFTGIILNELVGPLNFEQKKELKMVKASSYHLLSLINDVLDISKIEAGEMEVSWDTFNMRSIIEQVIKEMMPLAEKKGVVLSKEVAPEVGEITSDERRIRQVMINLVNNAIKFTDQGEVKISCRMSKDRLKVSVSDTGIGIKKKDMINLFKPFQQIDTGASRKYEGTGLGLSICKHVLDMLGGSIQVESSREGSIFTVYLPKYKGKNQNEKKDIGN